MTGNFMNISSYKQTNQVWNNQANKSEKNTNSSSSRDIKTNNGTQAAGSGKNDNKVKVTEWKPLDTASSLVPKVKEGYGTVIGDTNLSDKAKEYYDSLKKKFHGMDFILVSKDMKSQVASNAAAYGNASKPVVLIDEDKIERMANDESFRKKYEGIIAMSQTKLQEAKNSLMSSGANVKNFGMSVGSDGKISYFATIEKSNEAQNKMIEKKRAAKKAADIKNKKKAEKEAAKDRIEKMRKDIKDKDSVKKDGNSADISKQKDSEEIDMDKEYIEFEADSIEALINRVSKYAYDNSFNNVMTEEESKVGQSIDFKG